MRRTDKHQSGVIINKTCSSLSQHQDLLLLLRAVITMGVGLTPVAHLLPMQVLLNLRLGYPWEKAGIHNWVCLKEVYTHQVISSSSHGC